MTKLPKNITNLFITINLDGNISGTLDYNYRSNADPKSNYKNILFTDKYKFNKAILNHSKYKNNKKEVFLDLKVFENYIAKCDNIFDDIANIRKVAAATKLQALMRGRLSRRRGHVPAPLSPPITATMKESMLIKVTEKNNIQLILSIFFTKGSVFYIKGNKFIIDKYKLLTAHKDSDYVKKIETKYSYAKLEKQFLDTELPSEKRLLKSKQTRLKKIQELYNRELREIVAGAHADIVRKKRDELARFEKSNALVNYSEKRLDLEAEINVEKRLLSDNRIERYIENEVKKLNNKSDNKSNNLQFKYKKRDGIKLIKKNIIQYTINLTLLDAKAPKTAKRKLRCRTQKNKIKDLSNEVLGTKFKQRIKTRHISTLHEPVYDTKDKPTRKDKPTIKDKPTRKDKHRRR